MKKTKNLVILSLLLSIYLLFPVIASAHTMWINVTDNSPEIHPKFGAMIKLYFGWGHRYPIDDFLSKERLEEFFLISQTGKKEEITFDSEKFLTQLKFENAGLYIISTVLEPGFYTMYLNEEGEIEHEIGPKTGLTRVTYSVLSQQYAKALINVGEAEESNSFSKPVGHKLEIIPLENPYELKGNGGHLLPVKVLFDGEPARFCKVYATYSGFSTEDDFAYTTSTNREGIAKIRITHWGPWLIKTKMELPATDDLKDKCNELNYTATLTFEIP